MTTHSTGDLKLDDDVREELLELTQNDAGRASKLANETLRELIDYRRRFLASIEAGKADLEAGRTYSSDEVRAELARRRQK